MGKIPNKFFTPSVSSKNQLKKMGIKENKIKFDDNDNTSVAFESGEASVGYENTPRANNTLLYFSSSGHMGVGTTNPINKFEVSGSVKSIKVATVSTGSSGRSIVLEGDRIKFFETTEQNLETSDYDDGEEKAENWISVTKKIQVIK